MHHSPKKLLLFDIDGTLISTKGIAGKLMLKALEEELKEPVRYELKVFVGSTDRLILQEFIKRSGVPVDDVESAIDRILDRYLSYLTEKMNSPNHVKILPGVKELLNQLTEDNNILLGLVTGNIKEGAYSKLRLANLHRFFPFGAFGDDAIDRNKLPPIAIRRAEEFHGLSLNPQNVWIIGDSPKDVLCAKANELRSIAVASGWHRIDELLPHEPDIVLNDLRETETIIKIFKDSML